MSKWRIKIEFIGSDKVYHGKSKKMSLQEVEEMLDFLKRDLEYLVLESNKNSIIFKEDVLKNAIITLEKV